MTGAPMTTVLTVNTVLGRYRGAVLSLACLLPLGWCALAARIGNGLTSATSALVLVTLVVAAAATGDRLAGVIAALSGGAWFDFFLSPPIHSFTIDDANDIEIAVLLVAVGLAVTEISLWGRRQQASSSARAGYLDGVARTSQLVADHLEPRELIRHVTNEMTHLLDADGCRFVTGRPSGSAATGPHRVVLEPDGGVTVGGKAIRVDRDGLPTMDEIALPARHHGVELGQFMITASTRIVRPGLEERRIAVLLANLVGAELAARPDAQTTGPRGLRD